MTDGPVTRSVARRVGRWVIFYRFTAIYVIAALAAIIWLLIDSRS
jgi:hypothetical protein